jgi:riboflavin synthase
MFTGLVTAVGRVARMSAQSTTGRSTKRMRRGRGGAGGSHATDGGNGAGGLTLDIRASLGRLVRGESIAVNGACLTVERAVPGEFRVRAIPTTLERTLLAEYRAGRRVNLERAVRAADRLGGHWVQGHVDGIATITASVQRGDAVVYDLRVPGPVRAVSIPQGSITVDGVSLTVNGLPRAGTVQVALVPYTREHTTLGRLAVGDRVHVEGDVLAKYVRALCRSAP